MAVAMANVVAIARTIMRHPPGLDALGSNVKRCGGANLSANRLRDVELVDVVALKPPTAPVFCIMIPEVSAVVWL